MYWTLQRLPDYLRTMYEKETGITLALDKYGFPKQTSWGEEKSKPKRNRYQEKKKKAKYRTKEEVSALRAKVKEMVNSGMKQYQVAKELGLRNTEVAYLYASKDYVSKSWKKKS